MAVAAAREAEAEEVSEERRARVGWLVELVHQAEEDGPLLLDVRNVIPRDALRRAGSSHVKSAAVKSSQVTSRTSSQLRSGERTLHQGPQLRLLRVRAVDRKAECAPCLCERRQDEVG